MQRIGNYSSEQFVGATGGIYGMIPYVHFPSKKSVRAHSPRV